MFLLSVIKALDTNHVKYALVGGYAVSLHGAVRGTLDIDIILRFEEEQFIKAEAALNSIGLQAKLPITAKEVFKFRKEYIKNRNLTAWSFVNPRTPAELVDIIITHDLSTQRTKRVRVQQTSISLLSLSDLIRMKQEAGRPQDLADIEALQELSRE